MIRVLHIIWVSYKYRLDKLFDGKPMPWYLGIISKTFLLFPVPDALPGQRLRKALEDLGPLFVKFGQLLSTRKDLLSEETADALAMLQDQVTPFASEKAIQLIEDALGAPIDQLFSEFDETPLASASIAQVHCAILHDGTDVVVKVVRPGIRRVIEKDLVILKRLAWFVSHLHPDGKRLRPLEVVDEYHHILIDELDLKKEAANTSQLRRNFIDSGLLYVPDVYWNFCRENVLVMERIDGWAVTDIQQIQAQGTDLKVLAERGVEIFFRQVFTDNFFHADMHPGNIFVAKTPVDPPEYIAIDCAIIGSLSEFDQYYVARCLLAIFKRDYRTVAEIHVQSGWVSPNTRVADFESSIRSVCEPIFEKPLAEISFAELLLYLFQTARRFDMQVQPSLVLLQKTLLHIEGLGRQLYPDLDLWATAKPYLENWMKDRYSPKTIARQVERYLPDWLEHMPYIPDLIYENLVRNKAVKDHVKDNDLLVSAIKKQQKMNGLISILLVVGIAVLLIKL